MILIQIPHFYMATAFCKMPLLTVILHILFQHVGKFFLCSYKHLYVLTMLQCFASFLYVSKVFLENLHINSDQNLSRWSCLYKS